MKLINILLWIATNYVLQIVSSSSHDCECPPGSYIKYRSADGIFSCPPPLRQVESWAECKAIGEKCTNPIITSEAHLEYILQEAKIFKTNIEIETFYRCRSGDFIKSRTGRSIFPCPEPPSRVENWTECESLGTSCTNPLVLDDTCNLEYNSQTAAQSLHTMELKTLDRTATWTKRIKDWTPFHEYVSRTFNCKECPQFHKWESYFSVYHKHFSRYRNRPVTMMEVGVQSGGSALMWRWYFGDQFRYVGIDVNPSTKQFDNGDWCTVIIGDQSDPSFWRSIHDQYKVDIFLDDGGHTMDMQRITFENVFTMIDANGVYMCEDLATSYVTGFGGLPGVRAPESVPFTMIGLTQQFVDWINGYFVDGFMPSLQPSTFDDGRGGSNSLATYFTKSVKGIYFYSQVVVVEKSDEDTLPGT